jgi:hypothetical protein
MTLADGAGEKAGVNAGPFDVGLLATTGGAKAKGAAVAAGAEKAIGDEKAIGAEETTAAAPSSVCRVGMGESTAGAVAMTAGAGTGAGTPEYCGSESPSVTDTGAGEPGTEATINALWMGAFPEPTGPAGAAATWAST